jgi:hypothetical protein
VRPLPPLAARGEGGIRADAHQGMPPIRPNGAPQRRTPQAAVGHDQHHHRGGHDGAQEQQQSFQVGQPHALALVRQHHPGHGDGRSPVEHAETEDHHPPAQRGGIDGDGQGGTAPPVQHPRQQRGEAGGDVQARRPGGGAVAAVVEPLPQAGAQRMLGEPQRRHGGQDGPLAAALGDEQRHHPQRQAAAFSTTQSRQKALHQFRDMGYCGHGVGHGTPPADWAMTHSQHARDGSHRRPRFPAPIWANRVYLPLSGCAGRGVGVRAIRRVGNRLWVTTDALRCQPTDATARR